MSLKTLTNKVIIAILIAGLFTSIWIGDTKVTAENPPDFDQYVLQNSWGGESNAMNDPVDVAIGPNGWIYVVNRGFHRITIIIPGNSVFRNFGSYGYGPGQLVFPEAIAISNNGFLYVTDARGVSKFTLNGDFVTRWNVSYGAWPAGIAVDQAGFVYVADGQNHRIHKFDQNGKSIRTWGREGSGNGQFVQPVGLAVDANNHIYVADSLNHRIQKFTADGVYLAQWGSNGTANGQFNWPFNVAIGNRGEIYVSDWGNYRVQVFSPELIFESD